MQQQTNYSQIIQSINKLEYPDKKNCLTMVLRLKRKMIAWKGGD
jgi:hypothetical protein